MKKENSELEVSSRLYVAIFFVFMVLIALPAILVGLLYSKLLRKRQLSSFVHLGVIGVCLGLFCLLDIDYMVYLNGVKGILKSFSLSGFNYWSAFLVGLFFGPVLGAALEIWYKYQPDWVKGKQQSCDINFNGKRYDKVLNKIKNYKHPEDGILLGINTETQEVILNDEELNSGCLILGATGSGKTTTINNIIESCCQRNLPCFFIDGKGSRKQAQRVKELANKFGRKFYYFTITGTSHNYNPLSIGNSTELKDKLISISDWTEPHYKAICERYLQVAFQIFNECGQKVDVINVTKWLTHDALNVLLSNLPEEKQRRYGQVLDEIREEDILGLINRIAIFSESEAGEKLTESGNAVINLYNAVKEKAIVVMSLDSLMYPEFSRALGRMIVNDLKTVASRLLDDSRKLYVILDEFGVFAGNQVTDLINKSREAGFHNILSTQELADLKINGSDVLMKQIFGNTNVKIIHRQDVPDSAEFIAASAGTIDSYATTFQVDGSRETGAGTVKKDQSFIVHPNTIKWLSTGKAILIRKTPDFLVENIAVRWVDI
jgi:conjugal transfer pilus assembly protein TraD